MWREIGEGLRLTFGHPILRALTVSASMRAFFSGTFATLYTVRMLGVTPLLFGLLVTMGGVGALLGSFIAAKATHRFGTGKVIIASALIDGSMTLLIPLSFGPLPLAVALLIMAQLIGDCGAMIQSITEVSLRQMLVPDSLLGRVNASIQFLVGGVALLGAILAGLLSEIVDVRVTLLIGSAGVLCSSLWLLFSPVRQLC